MIVVGIYFFVGINISDEVGDKRIRPSGFLVNMFAARYGYLGKIKKLDVVYSREKQGDFELYDSSDGLLIQDSTIKFENKKLEIKIYYNPEKLEQILQNEGWINGDILAMLCVRMEGGRGEYRDRCYQRATKFLSLPIKIMHLAVVPSVYAGCTGTIKCGATQTSCRCSLGGAVCNNLGSECGNFGGGTCTCSTTCNMNAFPSLSCSTISNERYCSTVNQIACAQGGSCGPEQSCNWSCVPSCTGYCGTKPDGCGGTCPCRECGPTLSYSAWSASCGEVTRTVSCTENCGANDCAAIPAVETACLHCEPTFGEWSACGVNHKRSRSCTDIDGVCDGDDCAAIGAVGGIITENCVGTIKGTLFDAAEVTGCSLAGIASAPKFANQSFQIVPAISEQWPILSGNAPEVTTNENGEYSISAYAPAEYQIIIPGISVELSPDCGVGSVWLLGQGEVITRNIGLLPFVGGWWQVVGGSVHAEGGIGSMIPSKLTNDKLIMADANGRDGLLSYGINWTGNELGIDSERKVSASGYRIMNSYQSLRFDYDFYEVRMNIFPFTKWDGTDITFEDNDLNGYQIYKHTGDINLRYSGPTGTEKVILLVDGDVNVFTDLTVPEGAFLGIIAKGNINFDPSVANAQGWFVAENINVPCKEVAGVCDKTDIQFAGEGSFVGNMSINLQRDQGLANNSQPAEKFTYRPDFIVNIPTPMKVYTKKFSPFIP